MDNEMISVGTGENGELVQKVKCPYCDDTHEHKLDRLPEGIPDGSVWSVEQQMWRCAQEQGGEGKTWFEATGQHIERKGVRVDPDYAPLDWTHDAPTKSGYYWLWNVTVPQLGAEIVHVEMDGKWVTHFILEESAELDNYTSYLWKGPLVTSSPENHNL